MPGDHKFLFKYIFKKFKSDFCDYNRCKCLQYHDHKFTYTIDSDHRFFFSVI